MKGFEIVIVREVRPEKHGWWREGEACFVEECHYGQRQQPRQHEAGRKHWEMISEFSDFLVTEECTLGHYGRSSDSWESPCYAAADVQWPGHHNHRLVTEAADGGPGSERGFL